MSVSLPSFLLPSRCVLMIMDDGVGVYKVSGADVKFLDSLHWRESGFEEKLADIVNQSGAMSVMLLNDAVEQHYRKEKVPSITMFDRANIVQRRLNVAFPNFGMRAAKVLKSGVKISKSSGSQDKGQEKDTMKGDLYLFAAVASTDGFGRIMMALREVDQQIAGYGLLPVESTSLVEALVKKLAQKNFGMEGAGWSILLSQHRGGGLRQVVVKNGELALTRITPVVEPDPEDPGAWAADVSQELQATLSYLSRFGYVPEDGLDIIVMGDPLYAEALEGMIYAPCHFSVLPVEEVASLLGMKLPRGADSHHSDIIHAGWVGRKLGLDLSIKARDISSLQQPRQIATVLMFLSALGIGGVSFMATNEAMSMYKASANLEVAQQDKKEIEDIYQEELLRKQKMGIDVPLVKGALAVNEKIEKEVVDPLTALNVISRELKNIRLDKFEYSNTGPEILQDLTPGNAGASNAKDVKYTLFLSFAGTIKPKEGNEEIDKLVQRLNSKLSSIGYVATVTKQLQDLTFEGVVEGEAGITANKRSMQDRYKGEIEVKKVNKNG